MPVAPKRGLFHGCCRAAVSCVAVEANLRSADPCCRQNRLSLWVCWLLKQRWVSCVRFFPPPWALSHCLHALSLASPSVSSGHGHPHLCLFCRPSCHTCKCFKAEGWSPHSPAAWCQLTVKDVFGNAAVTPYAAHRQATWGAVVSAESTQKGPH